MENIFASIAPGLFPHPQEMNQGVDESGNCPTKFSCNYRNFLVKFLNYIGSLGCSFFLFKNIIPDPTRIV